VVPITPAKAPKKRYNVPISLWFVENSQRSDHLWKHFKLSNIRGWTRPRTEKIEEIMLTNLIIIFFL
jgi:hypothetical protein